MEADLEKAKASFESATEDALAKTTLVTELEAAKATLEAQLKEAQEAVDDYQGQVAKLEHLKSEVRVTLLFHLLFPSYV